MKNYLTKAYNEEWVENIHHQSIIKKWFFQKYLDSSQYEAAKTVIPVGFKHSNIFVKIGLFIFANIVIMSAAGLASLFFAALLESTYALAIICLGYSVLLYYLLDSFTQKNNYYRSGVDNALLYTMLSTLFGFFIAITDVKLPFWVYCLILIIILFLALIRYADLLVTIGLYITVIVFWFTVSAKFEIGKLLLPFVIMIVSAVSYWAIKHWRKIEDSNYYTDAQNILEVMALLSFYIGGNYYVVREGNAMLNDLGESIQIAFAPLFYFFTIGIPIFFIVRGLMKHDRKMLIVGLITIAFSIYTYQEYFFSLSVEWALTLVGTLLILLSAWAIQYLKTPKHTLTYTPDSENKFQNLEAIAVNQVMPTTNTTEGTKFGGGDFGGAGSGGDY
ncbi:MAG: hypothetical protein V4683_06430 [Bacteroidota bacterium]